MPTPQLKWADRTDSIFVTFCVPDCKKPEITLTAEGLLNFKSVHTQAEGPRCL